MGGSSRLIPFKRSKPVSQLYTSINRPECMSAKYGKGLLEPKTKRPGVVAGALARLSQRGRSRRPLVVKELTQERVHPFAPVAEAGDGEAVHVFVHALFLHGHRHLDPLVDVLDAAAHEDGERLK